MTSPGIGREWRTQNCTVSCADSHTFNEGCTFYRPSPLYAQFDDIESRNSPVGMGWKGIVATWCVVIGVIVTIGMAILHLEHSAFPATIGGGIYFILATVEAVQRHKRNRDK